MPMFRRRKPGTYVPLAANYFNDPAILKLSPMAELLFVRSLAFCASSMSDGYLTDEQVQLCARGVRDLSKACASLMQASVWERAESGDGFRIARWLKWNPSMEDITAGRQRDAARKRGSDSGRNPDDFRPDSGWSPSGILTPDTDTDTETGNPARPLRGRSGGIPRADARPERAAPEPERRRQPELPPDESRKVPERSDHVKIAKPPDLTELRAKLAESSAKMRARTAARPGALGELLSLNGQRPESDSGASA